MTTASATVGRPPSLADDDRKALILQAAETVFDSLGYGDATMEEVARACGMAKKTVYKFFPDKASLFGALVDSHDVAVIDSRAATGGEEQSEARLIRLLEDVAAAILSPRQITLTRLVIAESIKYPELAQRFYRDCVEKTMSHVAQALASDPSLRLPPGLDNKTFADMLVSTLLGSIHLRALMLNLSREALEEELRGRVPLVMDLIVRSLPAR
ncbi:MAG: TetR/AcrR family transcriptional regulator [Allorhizobium sp.]|uniref:TetR/AcrR family transcriptional regulator n=1 Tax=Allorhizobium sp. TaxID=633478 RepID=UPI0040349B43